MRLPPSSSPSVALDEADSADDVEEPEAESVVEAEVDVDEPPSKERRRGGAARLCGSTSRRPATPALRERLILHYSPLVKYVAGRVGVGLPPNIEQADLVSYGIFGLIDAIEKFDLERAHQVRDLRDQPDPRRDHRRAAGDRLDPALGPLQGPRGREGLRRARGPAAPHARPRPRSPTRWASRSTTCTRSSARSPSSTSSRSTSCSTSAARRATSSASVDTLEDTKAEDPVAAFESEETKYLLAKAINTLPEREKIVVTLYYYEGLTLAEIGQVLGVTESRICQMHTKAVLQLRGKLAEQRD